MMSGSQCLLLFLSVKGVGANLPASLTHSPARESTLTCSSGVPKNNFCWESAFVRSSSCRTMLQLPPCSFNFSVV
eukprot:scaffold7628_cov253-Ochromonas_danica.AAC.8